MRYQPSQPEENNNISPVHPVKEFGVLLIGMLGFILLTYIILGLLVDIAVGHISPELEADLFNKTPLHLLTMDGDDDDPRQAKLQQISDELRHCLNITIPITVHVQESETINAVALPGGHIIVYTGLLDLMETENSLRFILAHELGHFKNRDHLKGLGRGIVLMTFAAITSGPNSALTKLLTPTIQLSQSQYSQNREIHADETGLDGLYCSYGHVGGATDFFEYLATKQNTQAFSHYFASHPEAQERISKLHTQASKKHYPFAQTIPLSYSLLN